MKSTENKTKHTPGPWKTTRFGEHTFVTAENHMGLAESICQITDDPEDLSSAESAANARLIAAAPELLEACKAMFDLLEKEEPNWYLRKHYNIATATIAKAEGTDK